MYIADYVSKSEKNPRTKIGLITLVVPIITASYLASSIVTIVSVSLLLFLVLFSHIIECERANVADENYEIGMRKIAEQIEQQLLDKGIKANISLDFTEDEYDSQDSHIENLDLSKLKISSIVTSNRNYDEDMSKFN